MASKVERTRDSSEREDANKRRTNTVLTQEDIKIKIEENSVKNKNRQRST